jgi:hypothetical protein
MARVKSEMCRTCSTHVERYMHTKFWSENLKGRDNLDNVDVDGRLILKCKGKGKIVPVL